MAARGAAVAFHGSERLATVAELDSWARRAGKGDRFVYCEAPALIRGPTSDHARDLAQRGMVTTHNERRAGGGWNFIVVRTSFVLSGSGQQPTSRSGQVNGHDEARDIILRAVTRAANFTLRCPSDAELARMVAAETGQAFTRDQAQHRIRKLVDGNIIHSTVATEDGVPTRVVTIRATSKRTALPPKWAALERARKEAKRA